MKRLLPAILGFPLLIFTIALYIDWSKNASAATVTLIVSHPVISEIQISGANGTDDEFVEIYNPTSSDIVMSGWRLTRRASTGTQSTLVSSLSGTIPANGYFLIAHSASYSGSTTPDTLYSAPSQNIGSNNSVVLYSDAGITQLDLVGMGSAAASETATTASPESGGSVERKANSLSDATSMASGGADEFAGNGEDTDDNAADFVTRTASQPQNSQSAVEIPVVPTPTVTPTETPTPTLSPTPSEEPSATPSPTTEPSPLPTTEPNPTATPTITVSPTPSLTISPTPPIPSPRIIARGPLFTCSLNYKPWRFFNRIFFFPSISCSRTLN